MEAAAAKAEAAKHAIPKHITKSAKRLYRECLRRAQYVGNKHGNTDGIVNLVRAQFRKNMNESDPDKIQQMKELAISGLFNHTFHEAANIANKKDAYEEPA